MLEVFIDADGCPVKEEVYRVAKRYGLKVTVVANASLRVPQADWIRMVVVPGGMNVADDWIAEHAELDDIVITGDIPLASRCLEKKCAVLGPKGRHFSEGRIGSDLAGRELSAYLRETGEIQGGPAALDAKDRSRFLQKLDEIVQSIRRRY